MTIENKGNYFILDNGTSKMSIPKKQVIVTQDGDTIQIRLLASRKVLASFKGDVEELIGQLF